MASTSIAWEDILVIVLYFVVVLGVGIWASCRATTDTTGGYFLAGRGMSWIPVGASTWATNIGAPMFVGLAGSAAHSGIAVVMFEWHAMYMLILLGWVFLPVYMSSGCYTMPQYLKLRFGGQRIRTWLALISTLVTIISLLSGQIYAGALFIQVVFDWSLYLSIGFILVITAVYTVIGGLTAVMWTDTVQSAILIVGATTLTIIGLDKVGGYTNIRNQFLGAAANYTYMDNALYDNHTCGFPPEDSFHIFRPANDAEYPWTGMVFGLTILALNAWCTDQTAVQRSLAAKTITHGKAGVLLAAYLKILPFFFFIIPGLLSRVLYPETIACADPDACISICSNPKGCTNIAYPLLVKEILPIGVKGLMMAALLSALMSSLTSTFNSMSTIFTMDIWRLCRPHAKQNELMVVGRLWTVFLALVSMAWMPILLQVQGSDFWDYTQSISSYLNPPIVATFLMGIGYKGTTEQGAFWGLVVGLIIGVIRMGLEWSRPGPACGDSTPSDAFKIVTDVQYLNFACILFACSFITIWVVSLFTKKRPEEKLRRVTWWTRKDTLPQEISDISDISPDVSDNDDVDEKELKSRRKSVKYQTMKWLCGVDKTKAKPARLSKEEILKLQEKTTTIKEDPYWKRVLDVNAAIACSVCCFILAFWG